MSAIRKNAAFMAVCCICAITDIVYNKIGSSLEPPFGYILKVFGAALFTYVGVCIFKYTFRYVMEKCLDKDVERPYVYVLMHLPFVSVVILLVVAGHMGWKLPLWFLENIYNIFTLIYVIVGFCPFGYLADEKVLVKIVLNVSPVTIGILLQGIFPDFPCANIGLLVTMFIASVGENDVFTKESYIKKLSHDIRTPVSGIKGVVEMSDFYSDNAEKQQELRDKLRDISDFLLDVAENILAVEGKRYELPAKTTYEYEPDSSIKDIKVLIVEDNELNMEIARFHLEGAGAIVTNVWNGKEAVELFEESAPGDFDVILMDMTMPVMGGLEATIKIRNMERDDAKTIPIFAMTANVFAEDVAQCFKVGMNEHIAKPVEAEKIISLIKQYCNRQG